MWNAHLRGEETSFNPLGMVEALMGAMNHAAALTGGKDAEVSGGGGGWGVGEFLVKKGGGASGEDADLALTQRRIWNLGAPDQGIPDIRSGGRR